VTVTRNPVLDILFSQARVTVSGTVKCITSPCDVTVSMATSNNKVSANLQGDTFTFKDVLPGHYRLEVSKSDWCWDHPFLSLDVSTDDITSLSFVQTGYQAHIRASQAVQVEIDGNVTKLKRGLNSVCVAKQGKHSIVPTEACMQFTESSYTFDTAQSQEVLVTATHYRVSGTISSASKITELAVTTVPPQKISINENSYSFWGTLDETYLVTPKSSQVLFYPATRQVTVNQESCITVPQFEARPGQYIDASVEPALEGVVFTVLNEADSVPVLEDHSDTTGKAKIGPLYDNIKYKLVTTWVCYR
jgi:hypothetical protein